MESRTAAVHIVHFISDPSLLIDVWIVWMPLFCWAGYSIMSSIERDEAKPIVLPGAGARLWYWGRQVIGN